jgi:hypothetical protein
MPKPADEQRDGNLVWHVTRDTYMIGGVDSWRLESAILDCRHNELGRFSVVLTDMQADAILEQLTRVYERAKRKSFFDLEGWGFPEGEYTLDIEKIEVKAYQSSNERLVVHNIIVEGPAGGTEFQGEKLLNSFNLSSAKSWPFIQRLFTACDIELGEPGLVQELAAEALKRLAPQLIGKRYDATLRRVGGIGDKGGDRSYVAVQNERKHGAKAPYR